MKVVITSMNGTTRSIDIPSTKKVYEFINNLPNLLNQNHRVKVTCDLLGIDGYLQGRIPIK